MRESLPWVFAFLAACGPADDDADSAVHVNLLQQAKLGETPPQAYLDKADRWMAETGRSLPGRPVPCAYTRIENGVEVTSSIDTDKCVHMAPPKRWSGLWRNQFEGSRFCPAPVRECAPDTPGVGIWLSWDKGPDPSGGLYRVEFIGRRTAYPGRYGHLGVAEHEMIVDRMLAISELEAPPPEPTKAEMVAYWQECEARPTCSPSWEVINKMED